MKTYKAIAQKIQAMENCEKTGNQEWLTKHRDAIKGIMDNAPSGSGFDSGTELDDTSTPKKLVFTTSFHHMNEGGMYDGWTSHTITVKPSLCFDFDLKVSGKDRNQIKDYIGEMFQSFLDEEIKE